MSWPTGHGTNADPSSAVLRRSSVVSHRRPFPSAAGTITVTDRRSPDPELRDTRPGVPFGHVLGWVVAGSLGWAAIIAGAMLTVDVVG